MTAPPVEPVETTATSPVTLRDQLVAALVLTAGAGLDPASFEELLAALADVGPERAERGTSYARR